MNRRLRKVLGLLLLAPPIFLGGCRISADLPQGYALIYGVADYAPQGIVSLNFTDDDARDLADLLDEKGWNVLLRIDDGNNLSSHGGDRVSNTGPATLAQLEADITALASSAPEGSRFLFYYSGHGGQAPLEGSEEPSWGDAYQEWLFLYHSLPLNFNDPSSWSGRVLQDDHLGTLMGRLPEGMRMVVIDACNSGGFIGTSPSVDPYPQNYTGDEASLSLSEAIRVYFSYPGSADADILSREAVVAAAAGEREESIELGGSFANGLFTYHFMKAAAEGDANGDGWITLGEAAAYATDMVRTTQHLYLPAPRYYYLPRLSGSAVDYILFSAD